MELKRQKVQDLTAALIVADALVEFKTNTGGKDESQSKKSKSGKEGKRDSKNKLSNWQRKKKKNDFKASGEKKLSGDVKKSICFLCNGSHRANDCPTRGEINAIVAATSEGPTKRGQLELLVFKCLEL